ncbi:MULTISPECIES: hypothetical protein [unclassified Streptomyces]|uniref:hypothetical protein n=1 Tax=unclassified Streptomyces TaxID=2593676 RepID=UPI0008DD70E4|nr:MULTISPECIES: hypothetical protein [unclassified Streptomyces]OII66200.1 hypothetical protein BJP39_08800 [Streptomyces sp. CC77]
MAVCEMELVGVGDLLPDAIPLLSFLQRGDGFVEGGVASGDELGEVGTVLAEAVALLLERCGPRLVFTGDVVGGVEREGSDAAGGWRGCRRRA